VGIISGDFNGDAAGFATAGAVLGDKDFQDREEKKFWLKSTRGNQILRSIVFLLTITVLAIYLGALQSPIKSAARSQHLSACASIPDKRTFIRTLY
jgi:hypothetical protein